MLSLKRCLVCFSFLITYQIVFLVLEVIVCSEVQFVKINNTRPKMRLWRMLWEEWRNLDRMFAGRNLAWARCSVLRWVKNGDVNGALVGWWMHEELSFCRAQEVRFLTLQILSRPLISCLPCSVLDPGKNNNTYPPLWKECEYLYLSKWWKHGSQRENDSHRSEVQFWRKTPEKQMKSRVDARTLGACVYLCVSSDITDKKQLVSEKKSEQILHYRVIRKQLTVWSR